MAELSITSTAVFPGSNAVKEMGLALETLVPGKVVYKDATTDKFGLADSNSATAGIRTPYGVCISGGLANQQVVVQRSGNLNMGAVVVVGESYFLSDTPGGLCPEADLGAGEYVSRIGVGINTTTIKIEISVSGVPQ